MPHQFWVRAKSMSDRVTFGFEPSLLFTNEKPACSPDAKCVLCSSHTWRSAAEHAVKKSTATTSAAPVIRERMASLLLGELQCDARPVMIRNAPRHRQHSISRGLTFPWLRAFLPRYRPHDAFALAAPSGLRHPATERAPHGAGA